MIVIKKGTEPDELEKLRNECLEMGLSPKESYAMLRNPLKTEVLECLKRDQGQLCVYCMCKIPREDRDPGIKGETIEHFIPIDPKDKRDVGQGLDYKNLFAVCHGNTRMRQRGVRRTSSKDNLTCDKHRENVEFRKINPCQEETLKTIFYTMDGKIGSTDPDVEFDLVDTLNLNCSSAPIISERKAVLDALIEQLGEVEEDNLHNFCVSRLEVFLNEREVKTPYVGVLIWYLKSMIQALEA